MSSSSLKLFVTLSFSNRFCQSGQHTNGVPVIVSLVRFYIVSKDLFIIPQNGFSENQSAGNREFAVYSNTIDVFGNCWDYSAVRPTNNDIVISFVTASDNESGWKIKCAPTVFYNGLCPRRTKQYPGCIVIFHYYRRAASFKFIEIVSKVLRLLGWFLYVPFETALSLLWESYLLSGQISNGTVFVFFSKDGLVDFVLLRPRQRKSMLSKKNGVISIKFKKIIIYLW